MTAKTMNTIISGTIISVPPGIALNTPEKSNSIIKPSLLIHTFCVPLNSILSLLSVLFDIS